MLTIVRATAKGGADNTTLAFALAAHWSAANG